MTDESSRRPHLSDVLPSEAGILVRDALRAARHTLSVGRRRLGDSPVPGGEIAADLLQRVGRRAEGRARRMLEGAEPGREPAALDVEAVRALLRGDRLPAEARVAFVRAAHRMLRDALEIMGAGKALVLEGAIEAALTASLRGVVQEREPAAFAARLVGELVGHDAVGHVVGDGETGTENMARLACFAFGLALAAELTEPAPGESDGAALVPAAAAMTLALRREVAAAADAATVAQLYRTYAAHV